MHFVYVDTVNTKIKAHNALNAMYANTVDTALCGFTQHCIQSNEVSMGTKLYPPYPNQDCLPVQIVN